MRKLWMMLFALIALILTACGPSPQEDFAQRVGQAMKSPTSDPSVVTPLVNMRRVALAAPDTADTPSITPDQLFDWAEATYPQFFPTKEKTLTWSAYQFRYYKDTDVYLAVENGTNVVALGTPTGNRITELGALTNYAYQVQSHFDDFVKAVNGDFYLNGKVFKFGGTNADWIHRVDDVSIDNAFKDYSELSMKVIRVWAYTDIGSLDNSVPNLYKSWKDSIDRFPYMQYWDPVTNTVAVNENGLKNLDRMLALARKHKFKVIMTLTNNWANGGGVDQYNVWFKSTYHDDFYTSPQIKQAYKNWVSTLVNRTNTITGKKYRDDPSIFSWELGNELFCFTDQDSSRAIIFIMSPSCNATTITKWVSEMSGYIKSIDPNHMVSVGNIGFLNRNNGHLYSSDMGDDYEATLAIPTIDFATFHLYIDNPTQPQFDFATAWINEHIAIADKMKKPVVMEEFGHSKESRDQVITHMLETFTKSKGDGWLAWWVPVMILPWNVPLGDDYDGILKDSSTAKILKNYADRLMQ